jgi:hypothetical protein
MHAMQPTDRPTESPLHRARFRKVPLLFALAAALALTTGRAGAQDTPPQGFVVDDAQTAQPPPPPPAPEAQVQASATVQVQATTTDEFTDTDPSALNDFRDPLTPYGSWVVDATYGTVWVPNTVVVGADFAPYQTAGHWAMTDEGDWLWVSDYEWGHIPFHYGRWVWISGRGWSWIPGRVYAPAWVVWRTGDYGYIGWAPMPPAYYWSSGVAISLWVTPPAAYVFCPSAHVFHHHVHRHIVRDRTIVHRIAYHSRPYRPAAPSHARPYKPGSPSPSGASAHAQPPGGSSKDARPAPSRYHAGRPASPSLADAKIPPSAVPSTRVRHDARAVAWARPSTAAQARSAPPAVRSFPASPNAARAPSPGRGVSRDVQSAPRSPAPQPVNPTPARRPSSQSETSDSRPAAQPSQRPSTHSSPPAVRPSSPSTRSAPPARSTPHVRSTPSHAPTTRPGRR